MKKTVVFLLLLSSFILLNNRCAAQKAYDNILYKATMPGSSCLLQLAYGYPVASQIVIKTRMGRLVFEPEANEADSNGNWRFDVVVPPVNKPGIASPNGPAAYIILKDMIDLSSDSPVTIKGVYYSGKRAVSLLFRRK